MCSRVFERFHARFTLVGEVVWWAANAVGMFGHVVFCIHRVVGACSSHLQVCVSAMLSVAYKLYANNACYTTR